MKKTEEDCRFPQLDTLVIAIRLVDATWMSSSQDTSEWRSVRNFCPAVQDAEEPTQSFNGGVCRNIFSYG